MSSRVCRDKVRPLTKSEIDRRIEQLVGEVAEMVDGPGDDQGDTFRPRWISAADLVHRMRPFIVCN